MIVKASDKEVDEALNNLASTKDYKAKRKGQNPKMVTKL